MERFKYIKGRKSTSSTNSKLVRPALLEKLEPRILLSGDSLPYAAAPNPLQDTLLSSTQQIVQYAELLESNEQVEQEIHQELGVSDQPGTDLCEPIFTVCADRNDNNYDDAIDTKKSSAGNFDEPTSDLSSGNVEPVQTSDGITVSSDDISVNIEIFVTEIVYAGMITTNSPALLTKDGSMPIHISDADPSIEYATSIEIRGPPANETVTCQTTDSSLDNEELDVDPAILDQCSAVVRPSETVALPGLQLVDPTLDNCGGQVVYLDFDGADDVTYNGPVVVDGIDIPAFSAESIGLAGHERELIEIITHQVADILEPFGLDVTSRAPDSPECSTIYIGGTDDVFSDYGHFYGLAEAVDVGNLDGNDNAIVFTDQIIRATQSSDQFCQTVAAVIAHEVGHLLGMEHCGPGADTRVHQYQREASRQPLSHVADQDFEADLGGWSVDNGVWEVGEPTSGPGSAYGGTQCAATILDGNYPAGTDSRLISPEEVLPAVSDDERFELRFWDWYSYRSYEATYVQISTWDGATWSEWTNMATPALASCYSDWSRVRVDLTAYAGQTVRVGFYHVASSSYESSGWYIDDIEIWHGVPQVDNPEDFESGWGDWNTDNGVWQIGEPTVGPPSADSGTGVAGTHISANYPNRTDSHLIRPEDTLPTVGEGKPLQLSFWQWYSYSSGDAGFVEISTWDGSDWSEWTQRLTAAPTGSNDWSRVDVDLTAYAGQTVRIGFYHVSSSSYYGSGWYIDGIGISTDNNPPAAVDDEYTVEDDDILTVAAPGILANDGDPDGDPISAALISDVSYGVLTLNSDGSFEYVPDPDCNGTDSCTYSTGDGLVDSNVATVTIVVYEGGNYSPVALDDDYTVDEDEALAVPAPGVLANDSDPNSDPLSATRLSDVLYGTLTFNNDGSFEYVPALNFHGIDGFTYTASDGLADSNVATVTITVIPVQDPPVAVDNEYSVEEDEVLTVAIPGVLANDSNPDGDPLSATLVSDVSHGDLTFNSDGSFEYTPDADFYGDDSFTYVASDGLADSNEATVTIIVVPVQDPL